MLYNQEALELLFKIVGTDRCMFGTENPGTGTYKDPKTGKMLDDLKPGHRQRSRAHRPGQEERLRGRGQEGLPPLQGVIPRLSPLILGLSKDERNVSPACRGEYKTHPSVLDRGLRPGVPGAP